jgi:MoaA/NifB/PqqE/SkfB family radical SAM enzyme
MLTYAGLSMTWKEIHRAYDASRDPQTDKSVLCHAPFVNLNFEQNGHVTACCYNRSFVLGTYPEQSVDEIWSGARARALRGAFLRKAEAAGCELCFHQLRSRNFGGTLMRSFDDLSHHAGYEPIAEPLVPRLLEFEISNTCNLECIMCSGHFSSSIRANREKLPPMRSPYDRAFVDQLEKFLPTVAGARFLGGEPFLIERYYQLWDRFRRLNPRAELSITTNATIIPKRARDLLEELQVGFAVSLDGFTPSTYEAIRRNARFEEVMANVEYLLDFTRRHGTVLEITVCPMTYNWRELPALLEFCEERQASIHFNMVLRPHQASLGGLPADQLAGVIDYLEHVRILGGDTVWSQRNRQQWEGLVSQLRGWHQEKLAFHRSYADLAARAQTFVERHRSSATGRALSNGTRPLLSSFVHSFLVNRERASRDRVDFQTLLPCPPLEIVSDGKPPTTADLVLSAHLLLRFIEEAEGDPNLLGTDELHEEQQLLEAYLTGLGGSHPAWLDHLGGWAEERIRNAESDVLLRLIEDLLEALKNPEDWRREVRNGLSQLRSNGLGDAECQIVTAYFDGLVVRFRRRQWELRGVELDLWLPATRRDSRWIGPQLSWRQIRNLGVSAPPVRDLVNLRRLLDAMYLFHRCYEPSENHAAFHARLAACVDIVVQFGKGEAACRSVEAADPYDLYHLLAHASDAELRRHVESFVSAPAQPTA